MKLNKNMNRKIAGDVTSPECSLQRLVRLWRAVRYVVKNKNEPLPIKRYGASRTWDEECYIAYRRYDENRAIIRKHRWLETLLKLARSI